MRLLLFAAAALLAFAAVVYMALRGGGLGKKRAYLMALCSALFFSAVFAGAGSFFNTLENIWPSGLYFAEITADTGFLSLPLNGTGEMTLDVKNKGSLTWDSAAEDGPVYLSWHLLSEKGSTIRFDNQRIPFPHPIPTGESVKVTIRVSPASEGMPAGRYIFEFDLVCENVAWFADRGSAACRVPAEVLP